MDLDQYQSGGIGGWWLLVGFVVVFIYLGGVLDFVDIFWKERKVLIIIQSWLGSRTVND